MADGRAHPGRTLGFNRADPALNGRRERLGEGFDVIELDIVTALTGKAIDRIGITDLLQRFRHQNQGFFGDIDNATGLGLRRPRFFLPRGQPIVVRIILSIPSILIHHRFVG